MFTPRYSIIAAFLPWLFLSSGIGFAVAYLSLEFNQPILQSLVYSCLAFFLSALFFLVIKIHLPIQKIVREMKAMLTGKSFRKIMTGKRNELGVMAHFFNQVTRNIESISNDKKSRERMEKELNMAQKIQRDLLPENAPPIPGLQVTARTRSASEIGGDTFDFYVQENRTLFYVGDSTGHGVPAGIVMVMVDILIETFIDMTEDIRSIIIYLNKYLKPHLQTTMFMTMIFAEWIPDQSVINWVGCGHEYVIHFSPSTNTLTSIPSGGIAVGMLADNSALTKVQTLPLQEGDFVVLFSDGITEAKNVHAEIYDMSRLTAFIEQHAGMETSTEELFEKIAIDVGRFMNGHEQEDDMTLIVIKRTDKVHEAANASTSWESPNEGSVAEPVAPSGTAPA